MTAAIGSKIPSVKLTRMEGGAVKEITTEQLCNGKKVVIFGVPGAFTPTCSNKHLPGYVKQAEEFAGKGVDTIACVSVNDIFVMGAWGDSQKVGTKIMMLSDGNGDFARALGLEVDFSDHGMGKRMNRCAMLVDNGVIKALEVDAGGGINLSSAENMVCKL